LHSDVIVGKVDIDIETMWC